MPENIEDLEFEKRRIEIQLEEVKKKEEEQKKLDKVRRLFGVDMELTEEQKEKLFWEWIRCNAEDIFPEAKRFLGNSDTEMDFWEFLHTNEEIKENMDKDEPEKLDYDTTTVLMAQVIEWGFLQACKKLGKDPHWLFKTPEELREHLIKKTDERRY